MLYQVHLAWVGFELTALMEIGTDCIDSYKSNYHTIMATTAPPNTTLHYSNLTIVLNLNINHVLFRLLFKAMYQSSLK